MQLHVIRPHPKQQTTIVIKYLVLIVEEKYE